MSRASLPHPAGLQFGLRTLFVAVTLCAALFAVMSVLGAVVSVALGWFLLLIAAHVAGNAWGTRIRDRRGSAGDIDERNGPPSNRMQRLQFAPLSSLRERTGIGRVMLAASSIGAALGGVLGTYVLCQVNWNRLCAAHGLGGSLFAIVLGGVSTAIIGGFLGFLTSSFLEVGLQALRQATREVSPRK